MSGYVYFIQAKESLAVKIGWTKQQLRGRLSACQTGSHEELAIVGYFTGSRRDEKRMHDFFASDRLCGEWFRWSSSLAAIVAACREEHSGSFNQVLIAGQSDNGVAIESLKRSLSSTEAANDTTREATSE